MKILKTRRDLALINRGHTLGFVATMGALHAGHAGLIKRSVKENKETCLSIFVNPTQFNNPDDFSSYPDRMKEDLLFCEKHKVDYVFTPSVEEIYGDFENINLFEEAVSYDFEGLHRPGHFKGVLTVVLKLLNLIQPDKAYFGEKDYQQCLLIQNMAKQFFLETEIVGVEIERDDFGLALSSRNFNLSEKGVEKARAVAAAFLKAHNKEDFLSAIQDLNPEVEYYGESWGRALMAHYVEGVRLIDNKEIKQRAKGVDTL
jgi:pantoate--beta-alanine ligase